jgi:SPP1 gp7 family putative phage head morphogenesis protein
MAFEFAPEPHEEAIGLIKGKPVATRRVFDGLLPELRGRVFTVTGIEAANTMQRLRDAIAELPAGSTWAEVKEKMLPDISPYFGEDPEGADRRAELLIRTHGFQAFQAANWRTAQADEDTTHLQYLATEDTHVRESHLALNGLILPKDDPFWQKHLPPWDWGCRCRVRPMNPDLVDMERAADETRNPDDKLVLEGPALRKLREGTLIRDGQVFDVTPPSESNREGEGTKNAYEWHPDNLALSAKELEERYEPEVWAVFRKFAEKEEIEPGLSVWAWLNRGEIESAAVQQKGTKETKVPEAAPVPVPEPVDVRARTKELIREFHKSDETYSQAEKTLFGKLDDGALTHAEFVKVINAGAQKVGKKHYYRDGSFGQAFHKFTANSSYKKINANPNGRVAQKLLSTLRKVEPMAGDVPLHRAMSFKTVEELNAFVGDLFDEDRTVTLNRTLTSFSENEAQAAKFATGKFVVKMRLARHKSAREIGELSVFEQEKEAVLMYGAKLRYLKGELKQFANGEVHYILDVEEA